MASKSCLAEVVVDVALVHNMTYGVLVVAVRVWKIKLKWWRVWVLFLHHISVRIPNISTSPIERQWCSCHTTFGQFCCFWWGKYIYLIDSLWLISESHYVTPCKDLYRGSLNTSWPPPPQLATIYGHTQALLAIPPTPLSGHAHHLGKTNQATNKQHRIFHPHLHLAHTS